MGKWTEKYLDIVKEIFNRGHLIGNHHYPHSWVDCANFEKAEEIFFNIVGIHTKFIRPPYNKVVTYKVSDGKYLEISKRYANALIKTHHKRSLRPAGMSIKIELNEAIQKHVEIYKNLIIKQATESRPSLT